MKEYDIIFSVTNDLSQDARMARICGSLQSAGYQVLLVGREKKLSEKMIERTYDQYRIKCKYEKGKLFYIEYNYRLYQFLKNSKTKVYGAVDLDTIVPNYYASKINGNLLSFDAHEYFEEVPEVYNRKLVKGVWKKVGSQFIPKVNLAYTVGKELARIFSSKYGVEFSVIRNVPLKIAASEASKREERVILYQGMINQGRGVLEMIEAMEFLQNWKFWIVGDGDLLGAAERSAKESTYAERIKFYGFLPKKEIINITNQATLGLNLVSNEGLSYYYSLANKCFDYIQSGLPSIQLNYPEYASLNKAHDIFYLIDELSSQNLIEVINQVENDQKGYQIKVENNKKAAQVLTWEKEELKLIALYKRLLSKK